MPLRYGAAVLLPVKEVAAVPIMRCQRNGKPGYKWGESGYCYTYTPGDERSREEARRKAMEQGRAIEANRRRGRGAGRRP